jgi:hypothetical protein
VIARPEHVRRIHIPSSILRESSSHFLKHGKHSECYVLWCGDMLENQEARIASCVHPSHLSSPVGISVPLEEIIRVQQLIAEERKFLFGQVHTHPGNAFHSSTDETFPFSHKPGFFSIVVPNFGRRKLESLYGCEVFELKSGGSWRKLNQAEIGERFVILQEI